ncbi:MAG TPA: hypothetical protein VGR24_06115 [bacterium]|jgi:hypothetical protein|nr:hypothetical protein [bacterium]
MPQRRSGSALKRSAAAAVGVLALLSVAPFPSAAQQPGDCRPGGTAPSGFQATMIGHFSEGADEVAEFCRYLVRQRVWPSFRDLGSITDPRAAQRAHNALEQGTIDVLWVNSYAVGAMLAANRSIRLKVVAFTDFLVLHIGTRQAGVTMVTDAGFAPTEVAVRAGRSMFFADVLFGVLHRRPRCLEATVGCTVLAGEGLAAELDRFLTGTSGRAVVLASWALPPKGPDVVVRSLYAGQFHLVGVPPATVVTMQAVAGTMAFLQIPRGAYGPSQSTDVPAAAMTQIVVSATPPEVQARVRDLAHRLNEALFDLEPRINIGGDLPGIVEMTQRLALSVDGRLTFHDELSRQLDSHGLLHEPHHDPEHRDPGRPGDKSASAAR